MGPLPRGDSFVYANRLSNDSVVHRISNERPGGAAVGLFRRMFYTIIGHDPANGPVWFVRSCCGYVGILVTYGVITGANYSVYQLTAFTRLGDFVGFAILNALLGMATVCHLRTLCSDPGGTVHACVVMIYCNKMYVWLNMCVGAVLYDTHTFVVRAYLCISAGVVCSQAHSTHCHF